MKKDSSVELLRVFASLMVIACHIKFGHWEGNVLDPSRTLWACIVSDGVGIFFMITGFFAFSGKKPYKDQVKKLFMSVILPSACLMIASHFFNYRGDIDIIYSLKEVLYAFLTWGDHMSLYPHLWYIFEYIKCFFAIPLLKLACKEEHRKVRYGLIALGLITVIFQGINYYKPPKFGYWASYPVSVITYAMIHMLIGYEIYLRRDKLKGNPRTLILGLVLAIAGNALRFFCIMGSGIDFFLQWHSVPGYICTIGYGLLFLSINLKSIRLQKTIGWLGGMTFGVYLLHWMAIIMLHKYQSNFMIKISLLNAPARPLLELVYIIFYSIFIFIVSLIGTAICTYACKGIKLVFSRLKKSKN
ncbi:MAG: acyltransferase [Lachnospiraceae bacterium]|nr:acyltransferase [Lachnospiraceae bacterium]